MGWKNHVLKRFLLKIYVNIAEAIINITIGVIGDSGIGCGDEVTDIGVPVRSLIEGDDIFVILIHTYPPYPLISVVLMPQSLHSIHVVPFHQ